jgi:predicted nuclease of predicted toxin-antitoxin system
MIFLADEGVDGPVVKHLRENGYDVTYIAEMATGIDDETILELAKNENRILITRDKDFGELVYRLQKIHSGIILTRLAGIDAKTKAQMVLKVIEDYEEELSGAFTVIQPGIVRIRLLKE